MDKQQLLSVIKNELDSGFLSKSDLLGLLNLEGQKSEVAEASHTPFAKKITNIFYVIGGIIAILGVIILIVQDWSDIGPAGRILSTLGVAFLCYLIGLFVNNRDYLVMSDVFLMVSIVLSPLGAFVMLREMDVDFDWLVNFLTSLSLALIFGVATFIKKRSILLLSVVGFLSWSYYALISKIFSLSDISDDMVKWATILLGLSYVFLAYSYRNIWTTESFVGQNERTVAQNGLYAAGSLMILGGGIAIGGVFDFVFIAVLFFAFYASVFLKSKMMLMFSALFLTAHIIKLTSRFFTDSIGWSLALILIGFLVIGVGYMTMYLNRRFISQK
jgi:hypothetical protein